MLYCMLHGSNELFLKTTLTTFSPSICAIQVCKVVSSINYSCFQTLLAMYILLVHDPGFLFEDSVSVEPTLKRKMEPMILASLNLNHGSWITTPHLERLRQFDCHCSALELPHHLPLYSGYLSQPALCKRCGSFGFWASASKPLLQTLLLLAMPTTWNFVRHVCHTPKPAKQKSALTGITGREVNSRGTNEVNGTKLETHNTR